ncbi:MAG: response regulator, partial [Caldilineaceae bacterium]
MITAQNTTNATQNVLIVDDEARLSRFVSMCLDRAGYTTSTCDNVDEARRLLSEGEWSLVLTDLVMPYETGFDLLDWIDKNHPQLPVIVLTAHTTPAVINQVQQARVAGMLRKPFSLDELYSSVS